MKKNNFLSKKLKLSFCKTHQNPLYFWAAVFHAQSFWEKNFFQDNLVLKIKSSNLLKYLVIFLKKMEIEPIIYKNQTRDYKTKDFRLEIEKFSSSFQNYLHQFQLHYWQEKNLSLILKEKIQIQSYLQGIFAACGYLQDFNKGYLLEFYFSQKDFAYLFQQFFQKEFFDLKLRQKKTSWIVFLQTRDGIEKFLTLTQAQNELFEFLDHAIMKEIKKDVNRKLNFELANFERTNSSYLEYKKLWETFLSQGGNEEALPPKMAEAIKLRLNYPELSFSQLAEKGKLISSKSTLNYWLRQFRKKVEKNV